MKAYKGFKKQNDGTLWCRDFQYEVGKTYKFKGTPILCEQGFHACHEPWQCWAFYPNNGRNVYYEVECGGTVIKSNNGDGKFVCTEITLVREMPAPENQFDYCWYFSNGYALVGLNDKYNYIDTDGKLISEQWLEEGYSFYHEYARVRLNGKWNFINTEGKLLSKQWFDWCFAFRDGYARVVSNGKWNSINTEGKLVSQQWFDYCGYFVGGYAIVKLDGKYDCINTEGKYLSDQQFDYCGYFNAGYANVVLNGKYYNIDKTGKLIQL